MKGPNIRLLICRYPGYCKKHVIVVKREAGPLRKSWYFTHKVLMGHEFRKMDAESVGRYNNHIRLVFEVLNKYTTN